MIYPKPYTPFGDPYPDYSVKLHLMSNYKYTTVDEWLSLNIEDWFSDPRYIQEATGPVAYDIFYFKHEEDKVKFILRWL